MDDNHPLPRHGVGREVRDAELFGSTNNDNNDNDDIDEDNNNNNAHRAPPSRAPVPKRRRTASPPRRLPLPPREPELRLLGRRRASASALPPSQPGAKRLRTSSLPLRAAAPLAAPLDMSYLENRAALQRAGILLTRRTLDESLVQFDAPSWRLGRTRAEYTQLPDGGGLRLSELLLARAQTRFAQGRPLPGLSVVPDDFAFAIVSGDAAGPEALVRLERDCPPLLPVIESAWARIISRKYGVNELPDHFPSWRAFYEVKEEEEKERLRQARLRVRSLYHQGEAVRQTRQIDVPGATPARRAQVRRRALRETDPTYQPPRNALERLRIQVRRERSNRR